jgi:serine/threonine-protein kinase
MLTPFEEELEVGTRFAERFQILGVVGRGSMGIVYQARHELMGRLVAIKMLRGQLASDERSNRRFEREARAASRMDHPNLINVHDFGLTTNRQPYLVMDFAQGSTLYELQRREDHLTPVRAVRIFTQVCDALQHAHLQGVVHRDLKPSNIMLVEKDGEPDFVKVFDLGIAKIAWGEEEDKEPLTRTNEVCGSPIYLSPEQCKHESLDARSDIYSLGVVMYELLTGVPPLMGETVYDTIYMHVHEQARAFAEVRPDLHIPSRMERIVFKALEKDPEQRYQSMQELKWELQASLQASDPHLQVLPPDALLARRKKQFGETPTMPQQQPGRPADRMTPAGGVPVTAISSVTPAKPMPSGFPVTPSRPMSSVTPPSTMTPVTAMSPLPGQETNGRSMASSQPMPPGLFDEETEAPKSGLSVVHVALISSVASILITLGGVGLYLSTKTASSDHSGTPQQASPAPAPEQPAVSQTPLVQPEQPVARAPVAQQPTPGAVTQQPIPVAQLVPPENPNPVSAGRVPAQAQGHNHKPPAVVPAKHPPQPPAKTPPAHGKQIAETPVVAPQAPEQKPAQNGGQNPFFSIFQGLPGQQQKQPVPPGPMAAQPAQLPPHPVQQQPYGQQPMQQPYPQQQQYQQYPQQQYQQQAYQSPQQHYQPPQEMPSGPPEEAIQAYNEGCTIMKNDPERAMQKFQQAISLYPNYRKARTNLARARANLAGALLPQDRQRALQNYREALNEFSANGDTSDYQNLKSFYDKISN